MTDTLAVVLGDAIAGTLTRLAAGRLRFDYDDNYRVGGPRRGHRKARHRCLAHG